MNFKRGSGILMHITSLPGRFGIGDLGESSYKFIDFLAEAGQHYWQFLPVNPGSPIFGNSPYMSLSAFAGNPLLIDPVQLVNEGFLANGHLSDCPEFSEYFVEFDKVLPCKNSLLLRAFEKFKQADVSAGFSSFCRKEKWLEDYSLFMALREENQEKPWNEWPSDVAKRHRSSLLASQARLSDSIQFHKFIQYCFYTQWNRLKTYANKKGISLVGDIPIYVSWDSADVWASRDCFKLDGKTFKPASVAGVPPDYFSDTGQLWGNPIYHWYGRTGRINSKLYSWWRDRFRNIFKHVDIVRIDHFRGFESCWEVPAHEETAIHGKWVKGPGRPFFDKMRKDLGRLPIMAEDLGIITPEVEELRDSLGFPGMKILQFAFDSDENNGYLPHNYKTTNCVVYTGTHDNDTTLGWYLGDRVSYSSKERVERYGNCPDTKQIHWDFIRMAFSSVADIAIIPMQDILGFGSDCRMNIPSTAQGNWQWRCADHFLTDEIIARLRDETYFYGRGR